LTNAIRAAGLRIEFVPECLVPSATRFSWRQFEEFTNRQMIITRVYSPKLWAQALIGHGLYCTTLTLGLFLWLSTVIAGFPGFQILLLTLLTTAVGAVRGVLRLTAVTELMPDQRDDLIRFAWTWTLLAPIVPLAFLYNTLVAAFRRTITWRGISYQLVSPQQTRILAQ
jgi:hypothetical protein